MAVVALLAYAGILVMLPRIWRVGKVSDRSAAVMLLFNLPLLLLAVLAVQRVPFWLFALAGVILLIVPVLYFRFALIVMGEARARVPATATWWQGFSSIARLTIPIVAVVPSLLLLVVLWWLRYTGRFQG
jgi:hypothetical protein